MIFIIGGLKAPIGSKTCNKPFPWGKFYVDKAAEKTGALCCCPLTSEQERSRALLRLKTNSALDGQLDSFYN